MSSISNPVSIELQTEYRRARLERLLQAAAHDFEIMFSFGKRDVIGPNLITMKAESREVLSSRFLVLKARALHLLGHYLSGDPDISAAAHRQQQTKPLFLALWHALEDARLENNLVLRWPGALRIFEALLLPNLGGSLLRIMPIHEQLEYGLYLEGRGYRQACYSRKVRAALDSVSPIIEQAACSSSPQATFEAMLIIYPIISDLIRMGSRTPRPSLEDQFIDEEKEEQKTDQTPQKFSERPPSDVLPDIETSEDFVSVGVEGRREEFPEWFRPGSMPWFDRGIGDKEIHPSAVQIPFQTIVVPSRGDLEEYRSLRVDVHAETGFLIQRLMNTIREEAYLRFGGYYRTGKINQAKLWKQRIGNFRLFQRPVTRGRRAVAISLLVDESASMKGQDKILIAKKAVLLLGEVFDVLGLPFEIIGYTTCDYEARCSMKLGLIPTYQYRTMRCSQLEHRLYKRFDEPYRLAKSRITDIQARHNNWDEEHLMFAFQRFQSRPENHKLIIVLSDGQPNGDANHLIHTVERIESLGVKVIGVGIGADFVREIYKHALVVADFRQMAEDLLRILLREFRAELIRLG